MKFRQWHEDHMEYFHIGPKIVDNIGKIKAAPTMMGTTYFPDRGDDFVVYEDDIVIVNYSQLFGGDVEKYGIVTFEYGEFYVMFPKDGVSISFFDPNENMDIVDIVGTCYDPTKYNMETGEILIK